MLVVIWREERLSIAEITTTTIRSVLIIVIIVRVIRVIVVIVVVIPIKHALAIFEVLCYVVDPVLARGKSMCAKAALPWEGGVRVYDARLLIVGAVKIGVDISEVLREMVLSEAGLHSLHALTNAQA